MATLVHTCPHCLAERMTFQVCANIVGPKGAGKSCSYVFVQCGQCGRPACAEISNGEPGMYLHPGSLPGTPQSLGAMGWDAIEMWPAVPEPRVPLHCPDKVAKAFLAAEQVARRKGMEEMAAGSYGRALDIGTKLFAPDLAGKSLYERIRALASQHRISADLSTWAHEIRLIRNDALHEPDGVSDDDLVAIRGFTETVLTYLFTLPGMLAERQALTKQKPTGT